MCYEQVHGELEKFIVKVASAEGIEDVNCVHAVASKKKSMRP